MRLAIATSPSREGSATEPISRNYRPTESSVYSDVFRTLTGGPHDAPISRSLAVSSEASSRIAALSVDRARGDSTVAPASLYRRVILVIQALAPTSLERSA